MDGSSNSSKKSGQAKRVMYVREDYLWQRVRHAPATTAVTAKTQPEVPEHVDENTTPVVAVSGTPMVSKKSAAGATATGKKGKKMAVRVVPREKIAQAMASLDGSNTALSLFLL